MCKYMFVDMTDVPWPLLYQLWSTGRQARSECLFCTFRASCCSARLSRAQVPIAFAVAGSSVRDRGKKGGGGEVRGTACTGEYKRVQAVRPGSVAGGGCLMCYGIWNVQ